MIEEEQTTQASETADNQSLLAVTKEEEVAAEIEVPHRELTAQELEAQKAEEPEKPDEPLVRPDYWPENFWSEEEGPDVEALAKSYQELRTKFSQGKHKRGETYFSIQAVFFCCDSFTKNWFYHTHSLLFKI